MASARRPLALPLIALVGIGVAFLVGKMLVSHAPAPVRAIDSPYSHAPKETAVVSSDKSDRMFHLAVPALAPADIFNAKEETIRQGDVVEIVVSSGRPGAVIVHGLTDSKPVAVNGQVALRFRAVYSGRFDLHFHGDDGTHMVLMALNVMPGGTVSR